MRSGVRVSGHGRTMPIYSGFRASLSPKDLLDGSRFDEIKNGSEIHPCGDAKTSDALRSRAGPGLASLKGTAYPRNDEFHGHP